MVEYFYGADTWAARQAVAELAVERGAQVRFVTADGLKERSVVEWLQRAQGGLFEQELVVVQDAHQLSKSLQEEVSLAAARDDVGQWVVWDRGQPDKRTGLWRSLKARSREFSPPDEGVLKRWLQEEAQGRGGRLEDGAARVLVQRLGEDRWRLLSELERLLLMSEVVTVALVEQEVAVDEDAHVFTVLDAVVRGQRQQAVRGVRVLLEGGASEFYVLSMLAYQFRTLLLVRSGIDRGLRQFDIAREGGLKQFSVEKNYSLAQRGGQRYWRDGLTRVLATDWSIRQGKAPAREAVLMLVLSLAGGG